MWIDCTTMTTDERTYYGVLLLCVGYAINQGYSADISDAKALQEHVFRNYSADFRPLHNQSSVLDIWATFYLMDITEFDGVRQEFVCNGLFHFIWRDEFLVWNPKDFGGLDHFSFLKEYKSWFPVTILTNTRAKRYIFADDAQKMTVYSNGTIEWYAGGIFVSSCPLNVRTFPLDIQKCLLAVMPIHYSSDEVRVLAGSDVVLLDLYRPSNQWNVLDTTFSVFTEGPRSTWMIVLRFQRRSVYYVITVILQVIVLSTLNMAVFAIPAESGEKLSYSITIVLALVVFMSYVGGLMPTSSTSVPMLTGYIATITVSSSINVLLSVIILRLYHDTDTKPVPHVLQKLVTTVRKHRGNTTTEGSGDHVVLVTWQHVSATMDYLCMVVFGSIFLIYSILFFIMLWIAKSEIDPDKRFTVQN